MPVTISNLRPTVTITPQLLSEVSIQPEQASVTIVTESGAVVSIAPQAAVVMDQLVPETAAEVTIGGAVPEVLVLLEPNRGPPGADGADGAGGAGDVVRA